MVNTTPYGRGIIWLLMKSHFYPYALITPASLVDICAGLAYLTSFSPRTPCLGPRCLVHVGYFS